MDTTTGPAVPAMTARASTAQLRMLVLAFGPLLTLMALNAAGERSAFADTFTHYGVLVAVLAWSPLPWSFPAVLLDHERDTALPHLPRLVRAVALLPWMLLHSPARAEVAVSLLGWAALCGAVALT